MRRPVALAVALLLSVAFVPSSSAASYLFPATAVTAGHFHTCAIQQLPLGVANVECWGMGGSAKGYDGGDAASIVAGPLYSIETCVVTTGGDVHCWTQNNPTLGDTAGNAVGAAVGLQHRCVLRSSGDADCFGNSWAGQAAPYTGGDAVAISAGEYHTCVLTSGGDVDCWGANDYGQATDYTGGDAVALASGAWHNCVLTTLGNVDCWGEADTWATPDYLGGDAVAVTAAEYTCVQTSDDNAHCFGPSWFPLAGPYTAGDAVSIDAGTYHLCVLTAAGDVDCMSTYPTQWGQDADYEYDPLPEPLGSLLGLL